MNRLPICRTCGVQYGRDHVAGAGCRICDDERQYVGWDGQRWTSLAELREQGYRGVVREEDPGLWGIGTEPSFAIGQRALLVPGEGGNLMWDAVAYLDEETVEAVRRRGGVAAIAVSHPHFYSSVVEWSRAFGDVPVYVHAADRQWMCRRDGNVVFWEGKTARPLPGRTLVNCGVHFDGGTVLHWADGAGGRGALCTGDIFHVVADRRYVSFMYSYPNLIPESPAVIERALRLVEPFAFDVVYGAWWRRVVRGDAKAALTRSALRYIDRVRGGPPPAGPSGTGTGAGR